MKKETLEKAIELQELIRHCYFVLNKVENIRKRTEEHLPSVGECEKNSQDVYGTNNNNPYIGFIFDEEGTYIRANGTSFIHHPEDYRMVITDFFEPLFVEMLDKMKQITEKKIIEFEKEFSEL